MDDEKFVGLFNKFTRNTKFTLPVVRHSDEKYEDKLKSIYEEYTDLLREHSHALDSDLIESASLLCNNIIKIIGSSQEKRTEIMDQIICNYLDNASPDDLLIYNKKSVQGILAPTYYHSEGKNKDLLYLYRSMNRVTDINNAESNQAKLQQMFHCPYNLSGRISSTRYSMEGVPSLYLATSMSLSFSELKELKPGEEVYISKFKINREPTESVEQVKVLEFGIIPDDFNIVQKASEEDKDLPINKFRVFKDDLFEEIKVKESYLLWYPLFAACSFIRKNDSGAIESQEYPEYIIPQLFLTRLNEKSASTGIVYGIRYFSCADEESYLKGFNYVFPCGDAVENIHKSTLHFSEKLVDSFQLTLPEKYRVNFNESALNRKMRKLDDISIKEWDRFIIDDSLDVENFKSELCIHASWDEFIRDNSDIIKTVIKNLINDEKTTPNNPMRVFRFFTREIAEVKVIILGQDPYPQKNIASGRSFEVNNLMRWQDLKDNSSLQNIIKSIYNNYKKDTQICNFRDYTILPSFSELREIISNGCFKILPPTLWFDSLENQGVLFINVSLTCTINESDSHKKYWQDFSYELIKEIDGRENDIKWFTFGNGPKEFLEKCKKSGTPYHSMHPRLHGKSVNHIINFNWQSNAPEIKWLGVNEEDEVENKFEKGEYFSIENTI